MYGDSIDFASSKADTYTATNTDVLSELNAYFKSYIARSTGESVEEHRDTQEELDGIFNARTVDDAMDSIYRAAPIESSRNSMSSSSSSSSSSDEEIPFDEPTKQGMLDIEILDQHIDKSSLNGGSDASRAIENMAGGGLKGELDSDDALSAPIKDDFERNMLGGNASSEIRMWISGAGTRVRDLQETGIMEELQLENMYRNPKRNWSIWDALLYEKVRFEPNIDLILNCTCNNAKTENARDLVSIFVNDSLFFICKRTRVIPDPCNKPTEARISITCFN